MSNPLLDPARFGSTGAPPATWPGGQPAGPAGRAPFPPPPGVGDGYRGPWPPPPPGGGFPPPHPGGSGPAPAPAGARGTISRQGVATATSVLLGIILVAAAAGWNLVSRHTDVVTDQGQIVEQTTVSFPFWIIPAFLVAFGLVIACMFRPPLARVLGPIYAVVKGLVVGAISHYYEARTDGIVLQAIGLTILVFLGMLVTYTTGLIRVTPKFRMVILTASTAICGIYLLTLVAHLFGGGIPYIHDAGVIGIGFSVVVVTIASLRLLVDFDRVDRFERAGVSKDHEWYAALALTVSLVWLYLEILQLLSKINRR